MNTITLSEHRDLHRYGINPLTSEACAYGSRILCDLSQAGVHLVCAYFGLNEHGLRENWNSTVGDEPAVASIMLSRDALWELAHFALMYVSCMDVVIKTGRNPGTLTQYTGLMADSPYYEKWMALAAQYPDIYLVTRNPKPTTERNTHAMTGRSI